jgi:hypothetical protein
MFINFDGKISGEDHVEYPRCRRKANIKMDLEAK